jgi:histidinol-phosphatase
LISSGIVNSYRLPHGHDGMPIVTVDDETSMRRHFAQRQYAAVMPSDFNDDLRLAHVLADDADSLTMDRFKATDLHVVTKPDLTPVSDADNKVEEVIRRSLSRARPRDAMMGEEHGSSGWGPRRWVVAGVVTAPALGRRWWASHGTGAWTGRSLYSAQPCRVSDVASLGDASFSYSSLTGWEGAGRLDEMLSLMRSVWRTRAYGDFWSYMLVAEGAVDIAAEPVLALHDMAAISVVVEEAGGRFTSLDGSPGPHGGSALATNGRLHDSALDFLGFDGSSRAEHSDDQPIPDADDDHADNVRDISSARRGQPPAELPTDE